MIPKTPSIQNKFRVQLIQNLYGKDLAASPAVQWLESRALLVLNKIVQEVKMCIVTIRAPEPPLPSEKGRRRFGKFDTKLIEQVEAITSDEKGDLRKIIWSKGESIGDGKMPNQWH